MSAAPYNHEQAPNPSACLGSWGFTAHLRANSASSAVSPPLTSSDSSYMHSSRRLEQLSAMRSCAGTRWFQIGCLGIDPRFALEIVMSKPSCNVNNAWGLSSSGLTSEKLHSKVKLPVFNVFLKAWSACPRPTKNSRLGSHTPMGRTP
jgi:hypothetical protein